MPIGPYGGAPGFRSSSMRSPKPAMGDMGSGGPVSSGGNPAPRPMAPERPAGTQMFSGMRSPTSLGGTQVTPYERYTGTNPADRMNQKEFWQSGQAQQYSPTTMIRSALGMDPSAHPLVAGALRRKRMQAGPGRGGPGLGGPSIQGRPTPWHEPVDRGGYGSGTFAPQPRPMGPPISGLGGDYSFQMPAWAATPPSTMPMPPSILGAPDPRNTVLR